MDGRGKQSRKTKTSKPLFFKTCGTTREAKTEHEAAKKDHRGARTRAATRWGRGHASPHCDLVSQYYAVKLRRPTGASYPFAGASRALAAASQVSGATLPMTRRISAGGDSKDRRPSSTISLNLVLMYSSANALGTATIRASDSSPTAHTPSNQTRRLESSIRSATRSRTSSQMRVASWWGSYNIVSSS